MGKEIQKEEHKQGNYDWLKIKYRCNDNYLEVESLLKELCINTVCEEALCPNKFECFSNKTATFMILGRICSRNCGFCNIEKGIPEKVDINEPHNIALGVKELGLKHVVITSVTRDDLEDGGARQFAEVIRKIKELNDNVLIEVLIPDLKGSFKNLKIIIDEGPNILNHNLETVPELYKRVRPKANYERSLNILKKAKKINPNIITKSGIMVGLGEKKEEVIKLFKDLRRVNCDFITIGQYLSPSKHHLKVVEYVRPEIFKEYEKICTELGFHYVFSGPLVRSSYHASLFNLESFKPS